MTDNPLFEKWVEAMAPYVHYHMSRYRSEPALSVADSWLSWDIGYSPEAHEAIKKKLESLPAVTHEFGDGTVPLDEEPLLSGIRARHGLVTTHSWAVPTKQAIDQIVKHSPAGVVEIGAGTGYWARLLRARGLFVQAYDEAPHDNAQAKGKWSPVEKGGPEKAALWPSLTLLLCWPPYNTPMAFECLVAYKGDTLVYVGEGPGMATGDAAFHEELEDHWIELEDEYVSIPRWTGIRDGLFVYRRKGA